MAEFRRVLTPGGHILLAFFESESEPVTVFDHKVTRAYRWPIGDLATLAVEAGFIEVGRAVGRLTPLDSTDGHYLLGALLTAHNAALAP